MIEDAIDVHDELVFAEPLEGGHSVVLTRLLANSLHEGSSFAVFTQKGTTW
jgi:hypothetical protein